MPGGPAWDQRRRVYSYGWGGRIRTCECRDQNPVPYHLATPQRLSAGSALRARAAIVLSHPARVKPIRSKNQRVKRYNRHCESTMSTRWPGRWAVILAGSHAAAGSASTARWSSKATAQPSCAKPSNRPELSRRSSVTSSPGAGAPRVQCTRARMGTAHPNSARITASGGPCRMVSPRASTMTNASASPCSRIRPCPRGPQS